jgi:hypothetical protein
MNAPIRGIDKTPKRNKRLFAQRNVPQGYVIRSSNHVNAMFRVSPWLTRQASIKIIILTEPSEEVISPEAIHCKVVVINSLKSASL